MSPRSSVIQVPEDVIGPDWLLGASTRLVNAWTPGVEHILLAPLRLPAAEVRVSLRHGPSPCWRGPRRPALRRRADGAARASGVVFDTRWDTSHNFAHILLNQVPRALLAVEGLGLASADEASVVVPADAPGYARQIWTCLGFRLLATDGDVVGEHAVVEAPRREHTRALATELYTRRVLPLLPEGEPIGRKIFIGRRGARSIENAGEVRGYLEARGFTTVSPEEPPVPVQMKIIADAEEIVAVHGAALGPLPVKPAGKPFTCIELFGAGYISTAYRFLTRRAGGRWVGVRGRVQRGDLALDRPGADPRARQGASFSVDLAALDAAFAVAAAGGPWTQAPWPAEIRYGGPSAPGTPAGDERA